MFDYTFGNHDDALAFKEFCEQTLGQFNIVVVKRYAENLTASQLQVAVGFYGGLQARDMAKLNS